MNYCLFSALSVNDFDEELLQRGIIFSHGHALDGTRIGMVL